MRNLVRSTSLLALFLALVAAGCNQSQLCLNSGNGSDNFTYASVAHTEGSGGTDSTGASGFCKPYVGAAQDTQAGSPTNGMRVVTYFETVGTKDTHNAFIAFDPAVHATGTNAIGPTTTTLIVQSTDAGATCVAATGSVNFTSTGAADGGVVSGTYTVDTWLLVSGTGSCPAAASAQAFSATRSDSTAGL